MKKLSSKLFLIVLFFSFQDCLSQHLLTAFEFADIRNQTVFGISSDNKNDIYVVGEFDGTLDFNPDTNAADTFFMRMEIPSTPRKQAGFVAKYSATGNFRWAFELTGYVSFYDEIKAVKYDGFGNIYITGRMKDADFDPSPGSAIGHGSGLFLAKYDSMGNFKWVNHISTTGEGEALDVDNFGNVYMTGTFSGTADFDPSSAVYNLTASTSGFYDGFLAKYDSAGNFKKAFGLPAGNNVTGEGVALDNNNNIYVTGTFSGALDADPSSANTNYGLMMGQNFFLAKYDTAFNFVWGIGQGSDQNDLAHSVAVDNSNNIWIAGEFYDSMNVSVSGTPYYIKSSGSVDAFFVKYNSAGTLLNSFTIGGGGDREIAHSIDVDGNGYLYVAGMCGYNCDFNPSASNYTVAGFGNADCFFGKYTPAGQFLWAFTFGTPSWEYVYSIECTQETFWIGGNINQYGPNASDLDPTINQFLLPGYGGSDIFLAKYDTLGINVGIDDVGSMQQSQIFPNPSKGILYVNLNSNPYDASIEIFNLLGEKVYQQSLKQKYNQINIEGLPSSIYIVKTSDIKNSSTQRLILEK